MTLTKQALIDHARVSNAERLRYRLGVERHGLIRAELKLCANDVVHWVNHWCYTVDPRDMQVYPFDLWPKQVEFIKWLHIRNVFQESGLCEKSRDAGLTWMCCAYATHGFLFRPYSAYGFGSLKLEEVDRLGDMDSIFEKVRYLLYGLPYWMLPQSFSPKHHDNHCRIINPDNGSRIVGEGGDNIGRGGRTSMYVVDESAYLSHPDKVDWALSATTNVRIDVSTPNGAGNSFYRKRHLLPAEQVFTFHWTDDPRKDEEWKQKKLSELGSVGFAREYDLDYSASIEGICIPANWVRAAINFPLPKAGKKQAGLDVAEEGNDDTIWTPRTGRVFDMPKKFAKTDTTETAWKACEECVQYGCATLNYDAVPSGIKGTYKASGRKLPFTTNAIMFGESPTDRIWPDGRTSKEKFLNLRAEMYWSARVAFEKTFEYKEKCGGHPFDELISIPNCTPLIAQLSMPLVQYMSNGKIKIESKEDMRKRGIKSPDYADSFVLCLHEVYKVEPRLW